MVSVLACPAPQELEQLILGHLPAEQAERVERHVVDCASCALRLQGQISTDSLVEAVKAARQGLEPLPPVVPILMHRLKRLGEPATLSQQTTVAPADGTMAYLEAARDTDELGWLGHFRIVSQLGAGGMGVVFLAEDTRLGRRVALKVIRRELLQREGIRERFLAEARHIAAVEHESIVAIHEVDEHEGTPYLVMPLLRGQSLEERLRLARGPLEILDILRIGKQVAEGLAAAHARGLIHRDIKPANLFLREPARPGQPGQTQILDFGLASLLGNDERGIIGTPAYMAPEQINGQEIDCRADLFGLGCVLHEMATGQPTFAAADMHSTLIRVATEQPAPPATRNPGLPAKLDALILRLLAKDPAQRPFSAAVVADRLGQIEQQLQGKQTTRRLLVGAGAGLAMLALLGSSVWFLLPRPDLKSAAGPAQAQVTFKLAGKNRIVLTRRDEEETLEIDGSLTHALAPGDYKLRLDDSASLRTVWPDQITVETGMTQALELSLVGEFARAEGHGSAAVAVACAGNREALRVVTASLDDTVSVWNPIEKRQRVFKGHRAEVRAVAISPDGRLAASGGGGRNPRTRDFSVQLWEIDTLKPIAVLSEHESWVLCLAFSPDGRRLFSGAADGQGIVWDVKQGVAIQSLNLHDRLGIVSASFLARGKQLLTVGRDGHAVVTELSTGKTLFDHKPERGEYQSASTGAGRTMILVGTPRVLELHPIPGSTGLVQRIDQARGSTLQAVFRPGEKQLVTAGGDGSICLREVDTGKEILRLTGHRGPVRGVTCTRDGRSAVSCGQDGTVRMWDLPNQ